MKITKYPQSCFLVESLGKRFVYESPKHPLGTERFEKIVKERGVNYKVLKNGESLEL